MKIWGETQDEREIARQKEIEATQVKSGVNLQYFEKLHPPVSLAPDTMLIQPYQTSCRIRLAQSMLSGLTADRMDIRVNSQGTILVMIPSASGFQITRRKHAAQICSHELAAAFKDHGIHLPARFAVTADDQVGGWICRREN